MRVLILLLLITACGTIEFNRDKLVEKKTLIRPVPFRIETDITFYLWGIIPGTQVVDLAFELDRRGYKETNRVVAEELNDFNEYLWSLFTFGFYIPRGYVIKGFYNKTEQQAERL